MTVHQLDEVDLYKEGLIKYGSRGYPVSQIQRFLDELGYKIKPDGIFGNMTKIVVMDFQRHMGLKDDGIIGVLTKNAMYSTDKEFYCLEVYKQIKPFVNYQVSDIAKLLQYNLKGLEEAFWNAGYHWDIDCLHIIAHAVLESDWGRSWIARSKNNLFGWRAYDSSPYSSAHQLQNYEHCIMAWADWWNSTYLIKSGKYYNGCNEKGVNVKYATSPIAGINKAFIVQNFRKRLNG